MTYSTMNNTGKAVVAGLTLAALLGTGWWAIDRGQLTPISPQTVAVAPAITADITPISIEWLDDISISIRLVNEALASSGNISGSIALLDAIEARVTRHPSQQRLAPLRVAIVSDRERLIAARSADLATNAAAIDQMVLDIDSLPLLATKRPMLTQSPSADGSVLSSGVSWQAVRDYVVGYVSGLFQVRRVDHPTALLLNPEQSGLVAERLRFRLLSARLALVSRQETVFLQDIAVAKTLLAQIADAEDAKVLAHQQTLDRLLQLQGKIAVPAGLKSAMAIDQIRQSVTPGQATP
jgi:uncharacterized protein HemX